MLEVCVDTIQAALIAVEAGADRIELCSDLDSGGVTPSWQLVLAVRRAISVPLIVLIRSRAGDFIYNDLEHKSMVKQAKEAINLGADGIAIGSLSLTRDLHWKFLSTIRKTFPERQLVLHRAFDHIREPSRGIEEAIKLGFVRILTSGGPVSAIDGVQELHRLSLMAHDRIEIIPAGGIMPSNAWEILTKTGVSQLHGSFRSSVQANEGGKLPDANAITSTKEILKRFLLQPSRSVMPS